MLKALKVFLLLSFSFIISKQKHFDLKPLVRSPKNKSEKFVRRALKNLEVSTNWCGYVAAIDKLSDGKKESVSAVYGSWIVPSISRSINDTYSAIWIGIDGYGSSPTIEQIGTAHDWIDGKQQNYAWIEMFPEPAKVISGFPVDIGDKINCSVEYQKDGYFKILIKNETKDVEYLVPKKNSTSLQAERSCAEWIVEAPFYKNVLPLSNFGFVKMFNCKAKIANILGPINSSNWLHEAIVMIDVKGKIKALASQLNKDGNEFEVKWKNN